ncbi:MAG: hypothetical protein VX777_10085 [Chlamydiota bacterium]|nr:hypothetical protein [Chlamydiota bacterium]
MELHEWEEHFDALLDNEVDNYLSENEDDLFIETPMKSKEQQKIQTKDEIMKTFRLEEAGDLIEQALCVIRDLLPQHITKEEWEKVYEEFMNCDEALVKHFEAVENEAIDKDEFTPIHEMCGISNDTLMHCYRLGQAIYNDKEYADARAIFSYLVTVAAYVPEFWISAGMCCYQMEEYQQAIDSYKLAQSLFPDEVALYIHCANNFIANGDLTNAKIELDEVKKIFIKDPSSQEQWNKTYEFLVSRAEKDREGAE